MNSIALSLERLSGRDRSIEPNPRLNDLLSDDPSGAPPLSPQTDREA
jgi:hypothetical protein